MYIYRSSKFGIHHTPVVTVIYIHHIHWYNVVQSRDGINYTETITITITITLVTAMPITITIMIAL